jgi:NADH-quinone oxidoreductase subunit G
VPFIASLHILANASAELSNVVLPGTAYAEKRGSMINVTGRLQSLNKAVKTPGNARDTWEILRDLIVALGGSNGIHTIEDVFKRLAAEVPALNGLTFSKIGDLGTQVLETAEKIPLLEREKERKAKGIIVG